MKINQERQNILISEKFIKANIYLSLENKEKSKKFMRNNKVKINFIQF